jgi:sugar phosphate isomerase/epimerase
MWTVQKEAERSLQATLEALSKIGYRPVETVGFHGFRPAALRDELTQARLQVSSAHVPLPAEHTALATFVGLLNPDVTLELDTYWAQVGGADAAEPVCSLGKRAHYLHIKDGPIDRGQDNQSAVGQGTMDVPRILKANAAARWHAVEPDGCAGDIWKTVRGSLMRAWSPTEINSWWGPRLQFPRGLMNHFIPRYSPACHS